MENFVPIKYHQLRDFSEKINVTFLFIKQNFKSLAKALIYIAGPPALMVSLVLGNFIGDFLGMMQNIGNADASANYFLSVNFWLQILLIFLFGILAYVFTLSVIYNYVVLYEEKQSNQIDVSVVWDRVRSNFWMFFGTIFFFGLLLMLAYVVLILPIILLAAISPFLIFFGFMALIVGVVYVVISAVPTFIIRVYEKKSFFSAISRSFYLVRGKWWSTFGLLIILSLIGGVVSYIFLIPYYIFIFTTAMHQTSVETFAAPSDTLLLIVKIFFGLYYLAQIFITTLPHIGVSFQYFNLVEMKEARGLMSDIEKFGQTPDAPDNRPEEQY
jgi:hypothetical protein